MELTLSTHLLVHRELSPDSLSALADTGFDILELWLAEPHLPWRSEPALRALRRRLEAGGLRAGSVHLPFYPSVPELLEQGRRWSLIDPAAERRREALEGAALGLRAAAALGASRAVLHLGWPQDAWSEASHAWAEQAVAALLPQARACGVTLLLENIISDGTRSARLAQMLERVDPERTAGLCLDLGHAHVEGAILEQLEDALPRLAHLHVHDNDGQADQHLAPGAGSIPWQDVLGRLQQAAYRGQGALEIRDASRGAEPLREVLARELGKVRGFQAQWRGLGLMPRPAPRR